jgi:hypothetical protein
VQTVKLATRALRAFAYRNFDANVRLRTIGYVCHEGEAERPGAPHPTREPCCLHTAS